MSKMPLRSQLYDISEVQRITGVPRRTIHFYVKEGLLPPPTGRGRGARYGEEHVLRLRLIRWMKDARHIRLEGIRESLDAMSPEELRTRVARIEGKPSEGPLSARALKEALREAVAEEAAPPLEYLAAALGDVGPLAARSAVEAGGSPDLPLVEDSGTWTRIRVSENVEIHFRPTTHVGFFEKLHRLIRRARKEFAE